jgi:hypothetical protein
VLGAQFRVDERRLLMIGYGEEQLRNAANPFADANRRFPAVTLGR